MPGQGQIGRRKESGPVNAGDKGDDSFDWGSRGGNDKAALRASVRIDKFTNKDREERRAQGWVSPMCFRLQLHLLHVDEGLVEEERQGTGKI